MSNEHLKALIIERNKEPYVDYVKNTLNAMQGWVEGKIECFDLSKDTVLVCNEKGKIIGLPHNRVVGNDIIAGNFFIVGQNTDGEFCSLTESQIAEYADRFTLEIQTEESMEMKM